MEFHIFPNDYILKHYAPNTPIMLVFAIIKNLPPKEKRVLFYSRFVYTNNKTNLNKGKEEMVWAMKFFFLPAILTSG